MAGYSSLLAVCEEVDRISAEVGDKFLIYYAA